MSHKYCIEYETSWYRWLVECTSWERFIFCCGCVDSNVRWLVECLSGGELLLRMYGVWFTANNV